MNKNSTCATKRGNAQAPPFSPQLSGGPALGASTLRPPWTPGCSGRPADCSPRWVVSNRLQPPGGDSYLLTVKLTSTVLLQPTSVTVNHVNSTGTVNLHPFQALNQGRLSVLCANLDLNRVVKTAQFTSTIFNL